MLFHLVGASIVFLERHLYLRCLLEIQRNIQLDQEDEVLNASLLEACFG